MKLTASSGEQIFYEAAIRLKRGKKNFYDTEYQRSIFAFKNVNTHSTYYGNQFLIMDKDGLFILTPSKKQQLYTFRAKEWLRIEVAANVETKTFDLYVNGEKITEQV